MVAKSESNGRVWVPIVVAIIGAVGGAFGGNYLWVRLVPAEQQRIDPYTGTQGAALEARHEALKERVDRHHDNHPDITNSFLERIRAAEEREKSMQRQIDALQRDVERLEDRN